MSTQIDNRVVAMKFDNKQFESGVSTSLSTLDKLKKGLNLEGASKGLDGVGAAAKRVSFDGMVNGLEAVKIKFSALQVMAVTALANITNSALNAGKNLVKAFTIDPVKDGLKEYETQMNAIQTILANTSTKGTTLKEVKGALAELNTYSDKTIYNFTEMTKNIGTFTAAGVALKPATAAIKGIANLAAVSGSNAEQASTAMYQLSQAMASGSVKLMDWNSVVNAGMGGEVFQNSLKETARNHGINIDKMIKNEGSFRETLKSGWLSTNILTETLNKFTGDLSASQLKQMGYTKEQIAGIIKMGNMANDAATKVKTFTQLMDTLKEAAGSGWAQTWEIVTGDFEEAKKMFTEVSNVLGNIIGASAKSRNDMLKGWKDLGGRTALIDAISMAFNNVMNVVRAVGSAFKEIFPPTTSKQLYAFTIGLKNLMSGLTLSKGNLENLKSTFKGLFAILSIGQQIFSAVFNAIWSMMGGVGDLGGGILTVTGAIGNWLVGLDKLLKKSDIFNKVLKDLVGYIKMIASGIKTVVNSIIDGIGKFVTTISQKFSFPGFEAFHEFLKGLFERISNIGKAAGDMKGGVGIVATTFGILGKTLTILWTLVKTVAGGVSDVIVKMVDVLAKAFNGASFSGMLDLIAGLSLGGIAIGISKFLKSIVKPLEGFKGMLGEITGILDGVKGSFEAYQTDLKAGALLKIGIAIALLTASILTISLIDSNKLVSSLAAIGTLFGTLLFSMSLFNKIGTSSFKTMKSSVVMINMSLAVLILATAMKKLGDLDWNGIAKGTVGIAALSGVLVASAKLLSGSSGKMMKGSAGMVVFALAIKVLADVCSDLSKLSWEGLSKGLVGVGILLAEISLFLNTAKFSIKAIPTAVAILILSSAIKVLASACKDFGSMSWSEISKGLVAIGLLLTEITLFTNLTGNAKHVISTGVALVLIGSAMKILASALKDFGSMSWSEISKGLTAMGIALAEITIALNLMPKNLPITAAGLVVVGAALNLISQALKQMGSMSWDEIARGLVAMGGALTILSVGLYAMNGTLVGSAALLIAAGAIAILDPALSLLGAMSWEGIIKGLVALAGVFVILGVSALVLAPLIPAIIGLSASLVLLGVGITAIGAGLLLVGLGITALATGFGLLAAMTATGATAVVAALSIIIIGVAALIPAILVKIGEGIIALCNVFIEGIPAICKAIEVILISVVDTLVKLTPVVLNGVLQILSIILDSLIKWAPKLIIQVFDLLLKLVDVIIKYLPKFIDAAVQIVLALVDGINKSLQSIIDAAFKLVITFINGLANAIRNNTNAIDNAVGNLINAIIGAIISTAGKLIGAGGNIVKDILKGIGNIAGGMWDAGVNAVKGFINGLGSMIGNLWDAGMSLGKSALDSAKEALGIHSPSKKFKDEVGVMIGKGMAEGIKKSSPEVETAATRMANSVLDATKKFIDDKKYYNKISLEEELYVWQQIQNKYKAGTTARIEADKEVYRIRNEISEKAKNDAEAKRQKEEDANSQAFAKSKRILDDKKYYNQLTLKEEYDGWLAIQKQYKEGTDQRIEADKEVYRLKNELIAKEEDHAKEILAIEKDTSDKKKAIQDDYYAKTKEVTDKQIADVKALKKTYDDAVESRTQSLYSSYGLFDSVSSPSKTSGAKLIKNLQDQAKEFASWQTNLQGLSQKGISSGLLDELKAMGPKSVSEIKALNELSAPELNTYVSLWQSKHDQAKTQAVSELEGLRTETLTKIDQINADAKTSLDSYKTMWSNQMKAVNDDSKTQLDALKTEWLGTVGTITSTTGTQVTTMGDDIKTTVATVRTDTETEFTTLAENIQTIMSKPNWVSIGENIVLGIKQGATNKSIELAQEVSRIALLALTSAKTTLGIKSPSRAFAEVGAFCGEGFIIGLSNYGSKVANTATNVGSGAINAISNAISAVSDVVNGNIDSQPVIRPVLDLSDVTAGARTLGSMFDKNQSISAIASNIQRNNKSGQEQAIVTKSTNANSPNNQNGFNLTIENFVNNRAQDMENLATEFAFYMKQKQMGGSR